MKKLLGCCLVLLFVNQYAEASAIYDSRIINNSGKTSQISSSTLYAGQDYSVAIQELQNKIANNPTDYILNTYLIDLYLRSGMHIEAYKELLFLTNLYNQNKIYPDVVENIAKIKKTYISYARNLQDKSIVYLNLTLMNLLLGDVPQAENTLVAASKKITNENAFNQALSLVFDNDNNLEKALVSFDKMLMTNPNNVPIKKIKALYLKQLNKIPEACKEYNSALKLAPEDKEIIYNLYKIYDEKNISEAETIKKIFGKNNTEKAYLFLTEILMDKNEVQAAEAFAEKLANEFPENVDGLIALSEVYRRGGKLKDSYEVLKDVRDKADTTERISKYNVLLAKLSDEPVQEANSLMNNGLYEQALSVLKEANPENLYVILSKARANYFLKNKRTSLELLNRAMSFYPNNADVFYYFAFYFYQEKDMLNARKYINKTLDINPEHSFGLKMLDLINKADADKLLGDITTSIEMQNYSEAMRLTNEALSINPKDANLYFYKGIIYSSMNDYYLATAPFYKALELDKNNAETYYYLAVCFDNLSEFENALSYYQQFLDRIPVDTYGESEKIKNAQVRIEKLSKNTQ